VLHSLKRIWNEEEIQHRQSDELADESGSSGGLVVRSLCVRTSFVKRVKLTYLMSFGSYYRCQVCGPSNFFFSFSFFYVIQPRVTNGLKKFLF